MLKRTVSRIMLTMLLTSMLTAAFNVTPVAADTGLAELPEDYQTIRQADGDKSLDLMISQESLLNEGFNMDVSAEENPKLYSFDENKWDFDRINEWAEFAKVDGDSVELIIGFDDVKSNSYVEIMRIVSENGGDFVNTVSMGGKVCAVVTDIPLMVASSFAMEVQVAGLSRYIEPNMKYQACSVPNDPYWPQQWGPHKIEADYAWNTTLGNASVLVAVIDTGIDWNHPDLVANYVTLGYDWVNNDANPMDDDGHGTHCAGIIAAAINNDIGIAGLAQVQIMAEKGLDSVGEGYEDDLANAIIHAVDRGADILSNSWGGYGDSTLIHEAVKYAYAHGVLMVAGAGNDGTSMKLFPAGYDEVVAVTATDQSDNPASFTNFGNWVELAAPGVDIYSTLWDNSYAYKNGTSMACPHVSGVAALIWSVFSGVTRDWVRLRLQHTADDLGDPGFDEYYGYGRVNARKAIEEPAHDLIRVPADFSTIQEAVDAAGDGFTILVSAGTYYENVVVNKRVMLIGEDKSNTTVDGGGTGSVIRITADNVEFSGFTVQNGGSDFPNSGIYIYYSNGDDISNNIITNNNYAGIVPLYSSANTISGNNITNNDYGIQLYGSSNYNDISGNNITNNNSGISLDGSSNNNTVSGNNITNNNYNGIISFFSSNNSISVNIIINNTYGINFYKCSNNVIFKNKITNSDWGIYPEKSSNNKFYYNNFVDNTQHVYIVTPDYTNIWDNGYPSGGNYWSDYTGVDLYSGPYQNEPGGDGIGDTPYVIDASNTDHYPLMNSWPDITPPVISILSPQNTTYPTSSVPLTFTVNEATSWIGYSLDNQANVTIAGNTTLTGLAIGPHNVIVYANDTYGNMGSSDKAYFTKIVNDIAILNVTASPTETYVNQIVNINVTVKNKGTVPETFNVTVYYDSNPIDTQSVVNLAPTSNITITFSWNTSDVQKGTYTISAEAEVVPGETNTTDNTYIDNTVSILNRHPAIDSFTPTDTTPEVNEDDSLEFTHTSSDLDDDALTYSWLLDSVEQSTSQNWTYSPDYDSAGTHNITLVVSDGDLFDSQEWTVTVINVNRPPTAPVVDVTPDNPVTTDDLTCTVITPSTDPDNDTITYTYKWYMNGELKPELATITTELSVTIGSSNTTKTEVWKCVVTSFDGTENGTSSEDQVIIQNSPPSINSVEITPDPVYTNRDLTATPSGWSDPDNDPPSYSYQWQKWNGTAWQNISGATTNTLSSTNFAKEDQIKIICTPYDGTDYGPLTEDIITISNSAPTQPTVDVTPDSPITTDDLTCTVTVPSTDPDLGDTITYTYRWYRDQGAGFVLMPDETTVTTALSDTVSSTKTTKDDVWRCVVTPNDGTVNGPSDQDEVSIGNSPPSIDSVNITPDPAYITSTLTATPYGWYDADSDSEEYVYQWQKWVSGSWQNISGATKTLSSSNFVKDDQIKIICTPFDGTDYGTSKEDTITISNSAPTIDSFAPTDTTPEVNEGESLEFTHTSSDPDSDPLTYSWLLDSVEQSTNQNWTYLPGYDDAGVHNVTLVVSDGVLFDLQEWSVTVAEVNRPPTINSFFPLTDPTISEGESQDFNVTYSDPDLDSLTVQWYLNGTLTVATDSYIFTADYESAGSYNVTVIVSDGSAKASHEWTLTIVDVNRPPTIDSFTPVDSTPEVSEGESLGFAHGSSDPDGDPLTYSWLLDSVEQSTTQNWTYSPNYDDAGTHNVTLVVSDGGLTDSQEWNVTVINVNRPPTAPVVDVTPDNPVTTDDLTCTVTTPSTDPDNDTITYIYHWYRDQGTGFVLQSALTRITTALSVTISSSNTTKEDVWRCVVTPNDGIADGPSDWDEVTVQNTPPTIDSYYPPTDPIIGEGESQEFNITYHDPDGDAVSVQWYLDGAPTVTDDSYIFVAFNGSAGAYNITFSVSDASAQTLHEWTLTVYKCADLWNVSFIEPRGYSIVDFAVYNGKLCAVSNNILYIHDGSSWNAIETPIFVLSIESYEDKLIIGGQGGLYSYNGTAFTLIFTVPNYIKPLGIYNNTLYAGTVLDNPPILYYCNGSAENPDNWHVDASFSSLLNFCGPFGSIDSFAAFNNQMYVSSGATVYSCNGTDWSIVKTYEDVNAFLDMKVYNGKLYLTTRDQAWRKPYYQGYSGFSGRVIEFDGNNWTTAFDHDYWMYSLETYEGKLYAGTANKIFTYNGTHWETSFSSEEGAYYAISLKTYDRMIYAGMGNGYIFEDPSFGAMEPKIITVPEFPSFLILPIFMIATLLAVIVYRRKHTY